MSRQLRRSFGVAQASLGYHAKGTESVRPSLSSTVRLSSLMVIFSTLGTCNSTAEIGIPRLHEVQPLFLDDALNTTDFDTAKANTVLQSNRIKPKFDQFIVSVHVNMRRFVPISSIKEKTIRACSKNRRHFLSL